MTVLSHGTTHKWSIKYVDDEDAYGVVTFIDSDKNGIFIRAPGKSKGLFLEWRYALELAAFIQEEAYEMMKEKENE